jgi:hypothetical protein
MSWDVDKARVIWFRVRGYVLCTHTPYRSAPPGEARLNAHACRTCTLRRDYAYAHACTVYVNGGGPTSRRPGPVPMSSRAYLCSRCRICTYYICCLCIHCSPAGRTLQAASRASRACHLTLVSHSHWLALCIWLIPHHHLRTRYRCCLAIPWRYYYFIRNGKCEWLFWIQIGNTTYFFHFKILVILVFLYTMSLYAPTSRCVHIRNEGNVPRKLKTASILKRR